MASKACRKCEHMLEDGDIVKALVIARFKVIPSRVHYSISKPTDCLYLQHLQCADPKGEFDILDPDIEFE